MAMELNLETITKEDICSVLDAADIKYTMDNEGDISLKSESPLIIKIDKNHAALRFFGWAEVDEIEELEKRKALNLINTGSSTIKYSILNSGDVLYEYGILLNGSIDKTHLIKTIEHIIDKTSIFKLVLSSIIQQIKEVD